MKKRIMVLFTVFVLFMLPVISSATDYSSMSNEELIDAINHMRAELVSRELNPDRVICDSDGLTVTIKDEFSYEENWDDTHKLVINYVAVNAGDEAISFCLEELSVNGWEVPCFAMITLDPGKKEKGIIEVSSVDVSAEITSADDVEDLEFYGYTFDATDYNTLTQNIRMKVSIK